MKGIRCLVNITPTRFPLTASSKLGGARHSSWCLRCLIEGYNVAGFLRFYLIVKKKKRKSEPPIESVFSTHTPLCPIIGSDSERKWNSPKEKEKKKKAQARADWRKERKYLLIIRWRFNYFDAAVHSGSAPDGILRVKEVDPIHGEGGGGRTNITRYFPLYFLKQSQGTRMFTYTVCYCRCSSSRHRETRLLWSYSRADTGLSGVSQHRPGKTPLCLFRA